MAIFVQDKRRLGIIKLENFVFPFASALAFHYLCGFAGTEHLRCRRPTNVRKKAVNTDMKIDFLVVGKTVQSGFSEGITEYCNRIKRYIPFEMEVIPELKNAKSLSIEQQKEREGELILKALRDGDVLVLLDEHGKEFSSMQFADYLDKKMHTVPRRLVFVVGGPYGFSQRVYEVAHEKISLSKMTFSHQMIRLLFTEQLYRAFTILNHEPYHHE